MSYTIPTATLTVEHRFPKGSTVTAAVDVNLLVQALKTNHTDIGSWVNVTGYVTSIDQNTVRSAKGGPSATVGVQALLVWAAEDLDIAAYESALAADNDE